MNHVAVANAWDLSGKVALITGASRGIGQAMAEGMAACGAAVVVASRQLESVESVAAQIRSRGQRALAQACHVGDFAALGQLVQAAVAEFGRLDIVVNNAATNPVLGPLESADPAQFDKVLSINLQAPLELARQALPHLKVHGGSVINVSSVAGIRPEPMLGLYSVSKVALIGLTQCLAREWGQYNVRVNAICPGLVRTRFSAALWQDSELLNTFLNRIPLGRMAEPEELVPLAVFLAGDGSRFCTGGVYTIDGGQTA